MTLFPVNESLDESSHLTFLNYSIVVDIKLSKEPVELFHAWWSLSLSSKNLIEEVGRFDFIEHPRIVNIILVPNFINLV